MNVSPRFSRVGDLIPEVLQLGLRGGTFGKPMGISTFLDVAIAIRGAGISGLAVVSLCWESPAARRHPSEVAV